MKLTAAEIRFLLPACHVDFREFSLYWQLLLKTKTGEDIEVPLATLVRMSELFGRGLQKVTVEAAGDFKSVFVFFDKF